MIRRFLNWIKERSEAGARFRAEMEALEKQQRLEEHLRSIGHPAYQRRIDDPTGQGGSEETSKLLDAMAGKLR